MKHLTLFIVLLTLTFQSKSSNEEALIKPFLLKVEIIRNVFTDHGNIDTYLVKDTENKALETYGNNKLLSNVELTDSQLLQINKLIDETLKELNLLDKSRIKDGSIWELSINKYHPIKIHVQSPSYNAKSRGYSNLIKLKKYLDQIIEK